MIKALKTVTDQKDQSISAAEASWDEQTRQVKLAEVNRTQ